MYVTVYIDVSANTAKNDEEKALMKKYIAYILDTHHRTSPEEMVTVLFDMHKASTMSFVRFSLRVFFLYNLAL